MTKEGFEKREVITNPKLKTERPKPNSSSLMKEKLNIIVNWDKNNETVTLSKRDWEKIIGLLARDHEVNHFNWSNIKEEARSL